MEAIENEDAGLDKSTPKTRQEREYALLEAVAGFSSIVEEDYSSTIHKLESHFPGLQIDSIEGMHPLQLYGTYNELKIYARYRWNKFTITMGESSGKYDLPSPDWHYEILLSSDDEDNRISTTDDGYLKSSHFYKVFSKGFSEILLGRKS
jgi:hypothetical protein